jgi:ABC-type bacteriocin/lantibiotic exporter with double-glycine peptidase domain
MRKSSVKPVKQPDNVTCGPSSLSVALQILGKRVSFARLKSLCNTTSGGTSDKGLIGAVRKLGLTAASVERASRRHIISSLARNRSVNRATIVGYFYDKARPDKVNLSSGHWATVAAYSRSRDKIVVFDSITGKRLSYSWNDFRTRWIDYTLKRRYLGRGKRKYRMVKKWLPGPMFIIAPDSRHLPTFASDRMRIYA